jgi:putative transposase
VTVTTMRQFHRSALALLVMTGRVTMLGRSRWAGHGGSDRPVQRCFSTVMPWATRFWVFLHQHVYRPGDVYLLAGDAVVVTKAGQHTHGLDRFFARLDRKPGPGLAFFTRSLVSTQDRRSFPLYVEPVVRRDAEKAASQAQAAAKQQQPATDKRRRGRPQGSKNKNKAEAPLTPELGRIKSMITALRHRIDA